MGRPKAHFDGKAASRRARRAVALGLNKWLDKVAAQSQVEVPKDQLPLARSMQTYPADAGKLAVGISYDTEYALRQHEELSYRHPTPGTKAKYLEDPINDWRPKVGAFIAKEAQRAGL
jgi:hypothetical protein